MMTMVLGMLGFLFGIISLSLGCNCKTNATILNIVPHTNFECTYNVSYMARGVIHNSTANDVCPSAIFTSSTIDICYSLFNTQSIEINKMNNNYIPYYVSIACLAIGIVLLCSLFVECVKNRITCGMNQHVHPTQ